MDLKRTAGKRKKKNVGRPRTGWSGVEEGCPSGGNIVKAHNN